jgi:hypothetical protein
MMKRFLLVLTVGMTFAPSSVLASVDLSAYRPQIAHSGELLESEIDHRGTQCEIAAVLKDLDQNDLSKPGTPKSGVAR